jgi:general secretion pathway protein D
MWRNRGKPRNGARRLGAGYMCKWSGGLSPIALLRFVRASFRRSSALGLALLLVGCSSPLQMAGVGPGDGVDPARKADFSAKFPPDTTDANRSATAGRPWLFPGIAPWSTPGKSNAAANHTDLRGQNGANGSGVFDDGTGVVLNFENADIQVAAKSVLSDTLGLNVIIDPRVQGTITLISAKPIPRQDLLTAFEDAMRMSNAAVVREGNLVKILPLPEAAGAGQVGGIGAGFGVTIIPLRYTSAATVAQVAENFLTRPGAVRTDATRNLIMIQGTADERQSALNVISSFDVEWMRNQSIGIFPLKSTSPDTMIQELQRVFETADNGQGHGMINFQPITRMNAIMAVARNRSFLYQAATWIRRLDRSDDSGTTVRVYHLEYGNAAAIAKILNGIFVGRDSSTGDTAAAQLKPGTNSALARMGTTSGSGQSDAAGGASLTGSSSSSTTSSSSQSANSSLSANTNNISSASSFDSFSDSKKNSSDVNASGSLPRGVFPNVRITADAVDNSVVVFSNQDDYETIERSIRELDRPQLQVAIEATIAEVTLTNELQYGVQYYLGSTDVGAGSNNGSISLSNSSSSSTISQTLPGFNVLLGSQSSPKVILSALSSLTSVKVLSAPSLVVSNNQPAFLQVGDSVPVETGSATVLSSSDTVVNTVTYQDTGIILKVWPHVHTNGTISLEIEQEVSSVVSSSSSSSSSSTNLNPTISERRIHTSVDVPDQQTVLLGGLMSEEDNKTQTGIPILRQIQGLGDLFGTTDGTKERTEIIVFVKPKIIRDGVDAQNMAEEFRAGLQTMHRAPTIISGVGISASRTQSPYSIVK